MDTLKKMFEMINRLNHTPSESSFRLDGKIKHNEKVNVVKRRMK